MRTQKLTPKDKKEIAARVNAGERQKILVEEYGVSPALISRIVKQSKTRVVEQSKDGAVKSKPDVPASKAFDLSDRTEEQLKNRYIQIHLELLRYNGELQQRLMEADGLQQSIESESQKDESVRDESWILAQKKRLTWCQETSRLTYEMARLYQEVSAVLIEFARREKPVPYSMAVYKGLMPASKAK